MRVGNQSRRGAWAALVAVVLVAALLGVLYRDAVKQALHRVDDVVFHESVKDLVGRLTSDEDWSRAASLARVPDYRWMASNASTIPIAHGLGEITGEANSLAALRRSVAAGFTFFEVDLWLQDGVVHCFHGPGVPPPAQAGSCTFEALMAALPPDAWLVLDIKTDFVATGDRIVDALRRDGRADHVIFQLYKPADLASFNAWQARLPLAGPIVTVYAAHRSVNAIAPEAARAGVRAFTLPIERLPAFIHRPAALTVFVHPVDDCADLAKARAAGARGVYMENDLQCPGMPSIDRHGRGAA